MTQTIRPLATIKAVRQKAEKGIRSCLKRRRNAALQRTKMLISSTAFGVPRRLDAVTQSKVCQVPVRSSLSGETMKHE